ncbi:MAG: LytTR family DNA-binding domain-containing protein [Fermentimonas sp.]|nr:LytTR family DNA-binding domain-containing protein [Fermentimonas sp.]
MKLLFTHTQIQQIALVLLCIIFAVLNSLAYQPLVSFTFTSFLIKSLADSLVLLGIGVLLSLIIPSTNYVKLDPLQQFINYFALGILIVALWVALSFSTSYLIFGSAAREEFIKIIPMTAFIGILLYVIDIQFIHHRMVIEDIKGESVSDSGTITENNDNFEDTEQEEKAEKVLERIAVKVGQKIHVILVPDIIYIEADGDYVRIITDHGKYMKEDTMKFYEAGLPSSKFVRVHRSHIVNVEKILRIELYEKQNQMLTLKNGDQIRASVSGYKALRETLKL